MLLLLFNQDAQTAEAADRFRSQVFANSVDWTGIEERVAADPKITEQTKMVIGELKQQIEKTNLTNEEKAKAVSICNGLNELIDSPEPEWRAILNLFSAPALNNVLGIVNVIVFVFQLLGLNG